MIAANRVALVLLAAGQSTRFGSADKLTALLDAVPLGLQVARRLAPLRFVQRVAVIAAGSPDYRGLGFEIVVNDEPALGQARSIRLGVEAVGEAVDAALILLADMPRVTASHIEALLARYEEGADIVASSNGGIAMPPALFGRVHFESLCILAGDKGARALLDRATLISGPPAMLMDVDTQADLAEARRLSS
ncbi:nucleotidyltransferase family protein [Sphingomonas abietis]|uniref:Nucleotidyltransferase family protein n=1 Tax=Sphingomonas abietis TaxID=3012344 RepID=A0ABY7NI41_9SPHN|nr:nucleotidyltransferase family protein [Sphingomonas abietis]WBO21173.1 nucleotidyltransferase family protein [Sphingomonas abietis]